MRDRHCSSLSGPSGPSAKPSRPPEARVLLYFAEIFYPTFSDGHIWQVDTQGAGLEMIDNAAGGLRDIALNPEAGFLYWTDVE